MNKTDLQFLSLAFLLLAACQLQPLHSPSGLGEQSAWPGQDAENEEPGYDDRDYELSELKTLETDDDEKNSAAKEALGLGGDLDGDTRFVDVSWEGQHKKLDVDTFPLFNSVFEASAILEKEIADFGPKQSPKTELSSAVDESPWFPKPDSNGGFAFHALADENATDGFSLSTTGTSIPADDTYWLGSGTGETVTRYIANDNMAIYNTPFLPTASVAQSLKRGDRVFVFDDAPVLLNGGNAMVRVQVADRSPYASGYIPLTHLYTKVVEAGDAHFNFETTYGLISKSISEAYQDIFYAPCNAYPGFAGADILMDLSPSAGQPSSASYECGEYPIGDTSGFGRKTMHSAQFVTPAFYHDGVVFDINISPISLTIPVKMSRLDGQRRGEPYSIRNMSTTYGGQMGNAGMREHELYSHFPDHNVYTEVSHSDSSVRIHDSDFWFNTSYEPPAGVDDVGALAYLSTCFYLPGFTLGTGFVPTSIKLQTNNRLSHIQGFDLGDIEIDRFKVCSTAALQEKTVDSGLSGSVFVAPTTNEISVSILSASISEVSLRYLGSIRIYGDLDSGHDAAIGSLSGFLSDLVRAGVQFTLANSSASGESSDGPLLWAALMKGRLEGHLLRFLTRVADGVNAQLPSPSGRLASACRRVMPAAYRSPNSPFFPLYQQCLEVTGNAEVELVPPPVVEGAACHHPNNYARVSEGKSWDSPTDYDDDYFASNSVSIEVDRPYWASCGVWGELDTRVMTDYLPFLNCLVDVSERDINYGKSAQLTQNLRSECELPAVSMLCELYGDGEDLKDIWQARYGQIPSAGGLLGFCGLEDSLKPDGCTPATCVSE